MLGRVGGDAAIDIIAVVVFAIIGIYVFLMLTGIGFISTLTGTIASYFVRPEDADAPAAAPRNEFVATAIRRLAARACVIDTCSSPSAEPPRAR